MAQVKLNKSSLSVEQKNLKNYKQFLPSLELKRQKLLIEKNKAQNDYKKIQQDLTKLENHIGQRYPMAAYDELKLFDLLQVKSIEIKNENTVGVSLPVFINIEFNIEKYTYFNTPYWFEHFLHDLMQIIEMRIRLKVAISKTELLDKAVQIVTQRKNLFEKVLIPKTNTIIKNIQIFLADNERASVVRSKLAKKKRQTI